MLKTAAQRVLVLAGPTGVGKSRIAISLARRLNGEVVSGDSVQLCADARIGANKVTSRERQGVPHHLLDETTFQARWTSGNFCARARECIDEIGARGRLAIVVGGSGMYLRWLLYGVPHEGTPPSAALRKRLEGEAARVMSEWSQEEYQRVVERWSDEAARALQRACESKNLRRVQRTLELLEEHGEVPKPIEVPALQEMSADTLDYDFRCVYLCAPRTWLSRVLDVRCEQMLQRGLLDEVADLVHRGMDESHDLTSAIGYREAYRFLTTDDWTLAQFLEAFQGATRSFVRRQNSWFRREPIFEWMPFWRTPSDGLGKPSEALRERAETRFGTGFAMERDAHLLEVGDAGVEQMVDALQERLEMDGDEYWKHRHSRKYAREQKLVQDFTRGGRGSNLYATQPYLLQPKTVEWMKLGRHAEKLRRGIRAKQT